MAHSKKKVPKSRQLKEEKTVYFGKDPDSVYREHPSWSFYRCDKSGEWAFSESNVGNDFWRSIIPRLSSFETMTWSDILVVAKKENHSISIDTLNSVAQKRLEELNLFLDEIVSLRIDATHRLYGFLSAATFCVLWYDKNHGDNGTCVCRSHLKHT